MFFKNFAAACQKDKNKSTANHCKKARQETTTKKLKKIIKKKKKKKNIDCVTITVHAPL
jgi:high-affinity K+ transport system ATPase subunit B